MRPSELFTDKRKLLLILSLLLAAGVIIAVTVIFMSRGKADGGNVTGGSSADVPNSMQDSPLGGALTISIGPEEIFSTRSPGAATPTFYLDNGSALELVIKNGLPYDAKITLMIEGDAGEALRRTLTFEDMLCGITFDDQPEGEYTLSLLIETDDAVVFYTASENIFAEALARNVSAQKAVCMIGDISRFGDEELLISDPFVWDLNGFSFATDGAIRFVSDGGGVMEIINDSEMSLHCAGVYCDTPMWDFKVTVPFGNFTEDRPFYIYAASVNGKKIDCGEVYIDSSEDWLSVCENGELNIKPYVDRVVCEGTFMLEGAHIGRAVSLTITGDIGIEGELFFDTLEETPVTIDTEGNGAELSRNIVFNTPLCEVIWNGGDAPGFSYMEQYMNVLNYNGKTTDAYMGGAGTALLQSGIIRDTGSGDSVDFVPDGNIIDLSLGYLDSISPETAALTCELSSYGTSEIVLCDGSYYCIVTDASGATRGYKLNFYNREYKLPVIYITTDDGRAITTKENYVGGTFSINYNGAYDFADIDRAVINIKGRGNSSWELAKKPYKIKFESGTSLFGLHKAKRWVLIANHVDRSLIRNRLAYSIGGVLDNLVFVPSAYIVDVFVNGKYQGVYQLSEQLEVNGGRVPGEENSTDVDTDYFLEIGGDIKNTSFGTNNFTHDLFRFVEVKNPDEDTLTKEQLDYISSYVKSVEDAIKNGGDYESLLDVPSLIDWFLLYEFSYNLDGIFRRSDFLLKVKGGKLYFCTPWDFDYAFGNMGLDSANYHEWICLGNSKTDAYNEYIKTNIMDYLLKDPDFVSQLKARWEQVGKKMLDRGLETVDHAEEYVSPSADENFRLWPVMGKKIQYEKQATVNIKSYKGQLDYLRDFMNSRYNWMDKTIKSM